MDAVDASYRNFPNLVRQAEQSCQQGDVYQLALDYQEIIEALEGFSEKEETLNTPCSNASKENYDTRVKEYKGLLEACRSGFPIQFKSVAETKEEPSPPSLEEKKNM